MQNLKINIFKTPIPFNKSDPNNACFFCELFSQEQKFGT
jgi:hypothetical protein